MELSAIDAYIVHLPEEKQNEIKRALADKLFRVPEPIQKSEMVSKKDVFGLVEHLVKAITKGH